MAANVDFNCAVCLDTATEPVVTRCGHLFCWACLDHWLRSKRGGLMCPVCKGRVDEAIPGDIIPLYGKGKRAEDDPRPTPAPIPADTTSRDNAAAAATAPAASTADGTTLTAAPPAVRDTSYHFNFVRRAPQPPPEAVEGTSSATGSEDGATRPRPTAPRAPTPPPAARQNGRPFGGTQWHASPLSIGGSFIFLGGSIQLTILFILCWAVYTFLPWRAFVENVRRRVEQAKARGLRAFFETPPAATGADTSNTASPERAAGPPPQAPPPTPQNAQAVPEVPVENVARFVILGLVAFVVITNLMILA